MKKGAPTEVGPSPKPSSGTEGESARYGPSGIELLDRSQRFGGRAALLAGERKANYADLHDLSCRAAGLLLDGKADLREARVAFLIESGIDYVAFQWGIWRAGGVAVPLCVKHPLPELEYAIEDCGASILAASPNLMDTLAPIARGKGLGLLDTNLLGAAGLPENLPTINPGRRAMILYTSGTTGKPKGVVTTHANIGAQISSLVEAWEWTENDRILHFLPLHHIHGIINILSCCLWSGARCEFLPRFEPAIAWEQIAKGKLTLFMAVPTIYARMIRYWEEQPREEQKRLSTACATLRLFVSGSAALPVPVLNRWREISGHVLLERYGMTEIGMALSNPLHGERKPGGVGFPLPGVQVRLVGARGKPIEAKAVAGEIEVAGPSVFAEYWNRPDETARSFNGEWFRTGDVAMRENTGYRILGRSSVDIIKTGGYKVSALEIEQILLEHNQILEVAVVGIDDPEWGERVCAAVVPKSESALPGLAELRDWCRERLAPYKIPSRLLPVDSLPRNAMGKVVKPTVKELFTVQQ